MIIPGAKRAFGVGEAKSQNAVIKVYSAAELKAALTKLYQLPSGVGTIEIAGDIVITEPIKLRRFKFGESQPREIIIQATSGARIYNGNKTETGYWNYNQAGNTSLPVFDYGKFDITPPVCKYTFKDLTINSDNSIPFGAFIAGDLSSDDGINSTDMNTTNIVNCKLHNVWNVFASYDLNGSFPITSYLVLYNCNINGLMLRNVNANITETSLNTQNIGSDSMVCTNVGVWNSGQFNGLNDYFRIYDNRSFVGNNFFGMGARLVVTQQQPTGSIKNTGKNNIVIGCTLVSIPTADSFTLLSAGRYLTTDNGNIFATSSPNSGTGTFTQAKVLDGGGFVEDAHAINLNYVSYANPPSAGNPSYVFLTDLPINSSYQVTWNINCRYIATGQTNSYTIKSNIKRDNAGLYTIINYSTEYASEEVTTLVITPPAVIGTGIRLGFGDGVNYISVTASADIRGFRLPMAS